MAVQNIECQIANGQMSRYLAGDSFSPDMAVELRAHIAECPDCANTLERKRQILQAMLSNSGSAAVVHMEAGNTNDDQGRHLAQHRKPTAGISRKKVMDQLLERLTTRRETLIREPASTARTYWRPLAYSVGLAAVSITMSMIMRDPTRLLGDRAIEGNGQTNLSGPAPAAKDAPSASGKLPQTPATHNEATKSAMPPVSVQTPSATDQGKAQASGTSPNSNPETPAGNQPLNGAVPQPVFKPKSPKAKTAPRSKSPGIRVYDENGNPIR